MNEEKLLQYAENAAKYSYSPFSHFKVGAALITEQGKIYTGTNIENSSFSATVCAERVAFFKAISEGETAFEALAIYGSENPCMPCGICRQVMSEFCKSGFKIITKDKDGISIHVLRELLPGAFTLGK